MILTTHAIVGAALASFLPSHPIAAFVAGFASHFALDAIPHVDYPIQVPFGEPEDRRTDGVRQSASSGRCNHRFRRAVRHHGRPFSIQRDGELLGDPDGRHRSDAS